MLKNARNFARKYGSKAAVAVMVAPFALSNAFAEGIDDAMDAVDLTGIAVKVAAAGLLIIGIALTFKGPDLAKRVIKKV